MSEGQFQHIEMRFDSAGLGLSTPADQPQQSNRYPILVNVRQVVRGTLKSRPGLNSFLHAPGTSTPWHSLRRLTDTAAGKYNYIAGIGTILAGSNAGYTVGTTPAAGGSLTQLDTGYSGNPLSLLPFQAPNGQSEWMAVADSNKLRKVKYDGTLRNLGIVAPTVEPRAELDYTTGPLVRILENGGGAASWSTGFAGEVATASSRVNTAIGAGGERYAGRDPNLFGSTGWYALPLASLANITPGTVLTAAGNGATILVEEIHPASPSSASCTVERVIDDSGATSIANGWMWIVPSVSMPELEQHAYVNIDSTGRGGVINRAAIQDRVIGPDGKMAFRIYMSAGNISAGDPVVVEASVYGYLSASPTGNMQATQIGWTALDASTTNNLTKGSGGSPLNLNLSNFSTGGRAVTPDDEMVIGIYVSNIDRIVEMKLEADVKNGNFTDDYYTRSVAPHEFIPVTKNQITAVDNRPDETRRRINDEDPPEELVDHELPPRFGRGRDPIFGDRPPTGGPIVDPPGGSASNTSTGSAQWFSVRFKMSDWRRVGESDDRGLHTVIAIRAVVITTSAGTVDFALDDWQIIGGYEPDITFGAPYQYRYRYRDSTTGARSNWSPPSRSPVYPHRYQVRVYCHCPALTGVDKIDIQRRGGTVNDWRTIATFDITGTGAGDIGFVDVYSDTHALGVGMNPEALEGNVNAQPFTLERGPLSISSGLVVAGVAVYDATGRFNTSLAQGTPLMVNNVPTLVYRVRSANVLEVYNHCGQSASAPLEIPKQILTSQSMPIIFGTLDGWSFALGDTYNPGRLYFFNHRTLDSTRSSYWLDVSDHSAALLNGCVYNGSAYVWTSEGMFQVTFSGDADVFRSEPITGGAGLYARWALAVGDAMFWLGKDGIYTSDGGSAINITRRDLIPLFPNEGQDGADTNGIFAPLMPQNATATQLAALRLSYAHNKYLYFDFTNASNRRTLVMDRGDGGEDGWGWYEDTYTVSSGTGAIYHYADEGEGVRNIIVCDDNTGRADMHVLGGTSRTDNGSSIACTVRTAAIDGGDMRTDRLFGDGFVDVDPLNASITPTFYFDTFGTTEIGAAITGAARVSPPTVVDFDSGRGRYSRNIALGLTWSVTGNTVAPTLYGWGFSGMARPEETIKRATDYSDLGHWGPKELKGVSIECDTEGAAKTVLIEYTKEDGTVATISKTVNTGQKDIEHLTFDPVICYEARLRPTDANRWRNYEVVKWYYEPLTDLSALVNDWYHFKRAVWVQGVEIDGDTNNLIVSCPVQRDFSEVIRTISAQHNGRGTKAYSFDPPFIAYMVRTAPTGPFRRMQERWIWKPEAPIGTVWEAQEFELGEPYGFAREMEVEYAAGATCTLKYYVDGTLVHTDSSTLVSTGNTETFRKRQVDLPAVKGRLGKLRVECSSGVRVRANGTLLSGKQFGGERLNWAPTIGDIHGYGAEV